MSELSTGIVFHNRPKPISGDLRVIWRVSVLLLVLQHSRGRKASFAKLHVINDALRSAESREKLLAILESKAPRLQWRLRVEPALTRAIDHLVGERFAEWGIRGLRSTLFLTPRGLVAARAVDEKEGVLGTEKEFIRLAGKGVTEKFVQALLTAGRHLR